MGYLCPSEKTARVSHMVQCLCVRQLSCLLRNAECGNIHISNVSSSKIKNIFSIILILLFVEMHTLT